MKQVEEGNGHIGGWRAERGRTARFCVRYCQAYSSPSHYRLATTCRLFLPSLSSLSHAGCRTRMLAHTLTHAYAHTWNARPSLMSLLFHPSLPRVHRITSCFWTNTSETDIQPFDGTTALNWQSGRGKRSWPRTRGSKLCICTDAQSIFREWRFFDSARWYAEVTRGTSSRDWRSRGHFKNLNVYLW